MRSYECWSKVYQSNSLRQILIYILITNCDRLACPDGQGPDSIRDFGPDIAQKSNKNFIFKAAIHGCRLVWSVVGPKCRLVEKVIKKPKNSEKNLVFIFSDPSIRYNFDPGCWRDLHLLY